MSLQLPEQFATGITWLLHQSERAQALAGQRADPDVTSFTHFKSQNNVEMYKDVSQQLQILKGVGVIRASVAAVNYVLNADFQKWDEGLVDYKDLRSESCSYEGAQVGVYYCKYNLGGGPFIKDRDFVLREISLRLPNGTHVIHTHSVDESEMIKGIPDKTGAIRAWLGPSGWVLVPLEDGTTHVTYITQTDLKGGLPSWLVNSSAAGQLLCVDAVRKLAEKQQATQGAAVPL